MKKIIALLLCMFLCVPLAQAQKIVLPEGFLKYVSEDGKQLLLFGAQPTSFDNSEYEMLQYRFAKNKNDVWEWQKTEAASPALPYEYVILEMLYAERVKGNIEVSLHYQDENAIDVFSYPLASLPNVFTAEELQTTDVLNAHFGMLGYLLSDDTNNKQVLARLFATQMPNLEFVDGVYTGKELQCVAKNAEGTHYIVCIAFDPKGVVSQMSGAVPPQTRFVTNEAGYYLNLGDDFQVKLVRMGKNHFGVEETSNYWCFSNRMLSKHGNQVYPLLYGASNLEDISKIDWLQFPQSLEDFKEQAIIDGYCTPKNPEFEQRLHLRAEPNKESVSLGKFYNGTMCKVLEQKDGWAKVQIGRIDDGYHLIGWMLSEFLAFGEDMSYSTNLAGTQMAAKPFVELKAQNYNKVPRTVVKDFLLIGLTTNGSNQYILQHRYTGDIAYIQMEDLSVGNG